MGGRGGNGGNGPIDGGGGGAGGYGAVVTGTGNVGTVNFNLTGGNGGTGGSGGGAPDYSGDGGTGGTGLRIDNATFTNAATITGGTGGAGGGSGTPSIPGRPGASGAGISGAGLTITNIGTIIGGGSGAANAITFTSGTNVLNYGGTITGNLAIQATGSTLQINAAAGGSTVANVITGAGGIIQNSANTLMLTGTNTYSGGTTINAGILSVGANANLGAAAGSLTFGGGTLEITANGFTSARGITLNAAGGTVQVDTAGNTSTLTGAITGTGGLVKTGAGTLTLTNAGNNSTGATTISAGTLALANAGSIASSSTIALATGATFDISGVTNGGASITGLSNTTAEQTGTVALGANALTLTAASASYAGTITGTGGLTLASGTQALTGNNTYSGPTTLGGGVLNVNSSAALGNGSATNTLIFNGGTLQIGGGFNSPASRGVVLNATGTISINRRLQPQIAGNIVDGTANGAPVAGRLIVTGGGILGLSGTNTYTGGTTINASGLSVNSAANLGSGGITFANANNDPIAPALFTGGTFTLGQAVTLNVTGFFSPAANTTLTVDQAVTGAGGLGKIGDGTLVLSGANSYGGATSILAGTLEAQNGAAIPDTSRVFFGNNAGTAATFRVTNSETIGSLAGGNASSTVAIAAGQTLTVGGDNTGDGNYAGAITGATGLLVKTGTGTQTLSGALTNGGVQVGQGSLVMSGSLTTAGTAYNGSAPAALVDRGGTSLTVSGTITATSAAGLEDAVQLNGGSLTLTSTGQITGKTRGVNALTGGTISNAGSITGGAGIAFQTAGAQTFTVTGAGSITGTSNTSNGIQGQAMGTGAITLGTLAAPLGNVSGQNAGIGFSGDNNPISIVTNGAITGQSDNGIYVNQPNGTAPISITQLGGSIASNVGNLAPAASAALYAISGSGPVTISTAGSVTSNNGAAIRVDGTGTNSVTNSGTVQGVIGLRVVGGTTTLANTGTIASTAAGGNALKIDSGTLIIGEQAGTLTGTLNIASAASTLRVDRMADLSLANPLTGAGTLDKRGTGTLILTGQSPAFTGDTIVNAGVLQVDGLLGSANVTVNSGGTLAGSGKIGDPLINAGGTLAPGSASSIGTLAITGPLTFAPGSFYAVKITPTANDRTNVTGPTAIQGGTVQVLAGSGTYTPNLRYTLINSTGGVTGQFSALQTTSNLAFLTPSLSYDANNVYLGFAQTAAVTTVASTPNQTGVAAALNGAAPTVTTTVTTNPTTGQTTTQTAISNVTPAAQVAVAVLNQTAPGAVQALNALSGEIQASAISAELQTAFVVQEAILDHLRFGESNGFGEPGLGSPGLTGAIGQRFAPGTTLPAMYTADLPGGSAVGAVPVRPVPPSYGVWGQAFGSFGDAGDRNAARSTRQVGGFVLGAEIGAGVLGGPFSEWRAGVAAGYSFTSFDVTARQSTGQVESGFGAVYARGPLGPIQIRLGAAYAGNALDTRRAVIFPGFSQSVTGKTGGETIQGFGEVGYRIGFAAGYIEPFVGGAAIHIGRDGFAEIGGASALTVYGRSFDVQTATAGVQGQAVVAELFGGAGPLVARGLVGYRRAFGDVVPSALLAFGGGGQSFLTAGVPVAQDAAVASAGLDWQVAANTTVGLSYNGQVGSQAQDHAVKGSFSYRW